MCVFLLFFPLAKSAYSVSSKVQQIQMEIMTNGPVEAAFTVYADFPHYKSGTFPQLVRKENVTNGNGYWFDHVLIVRSRGCLHCVR